MNEDVDKFISLLISESSILSDVYNVSKVYWHPDSPPSTVLLGDIGYEIVSNINNFDQEIVRTIFILIERGASSPSVMLRTVVLTGLVEGMCSHSLLTGDLLVQIRSLLGPESRSHADAWMSW
ncbi:hypothetical protein ACERNI_17750 [Camelimonas sp. ID_303_24]